MKSRSQSKILKILLTLAIVTQVQPQTPSYAVGTPFNTHPTADNFGYSNSNVKYIPGTSAPYLFAVLTVETSLDIYEVDAAGAITVHKRWL